MREKARTSAAAKMTVSRVPTPMPDLDDPVARVTKLLVPFICASRIYYRENVNLAKAGAVLMARVASTRRAQPRS